MGFLDKLRKPRPTLAITADRTRVAPGEEVTVEAVISGEMHPKIDHFELGLLGAGTWKADVNVPGEKVDITISALHHKDLRELPPMTGSHRATLLVPPDAPATCKAVNLSLVTWHAMLRGSGGPYLHEVQEVIVVAPPDRAAAREDLPPVQEATDDRISVDLVLDRRVVGGGVLKGTVVVRASATATVRTVTVAATANMVSADEDILDGDLATPYEDRPAKSFDRQVSGVHTTLAVDKDLTTGGEVGVPFELRLPDRALITVATRRVRLHWRCVATAELEGRAKAAATAVELNVFTPDDVPLGPMTTFNG